MAKKRSKGKNPRRDIVSEFDRYFGNENELANWQRLCEDVGIMDELRSITQCRKALRKVWVNIYDLLDAQKTGTLPQRFSSERALAKYTIENHKMYPKHEAKRRGPVRAMLAHIIN